MPHIDAPDWFSNALALTPDIAETTVAGARISYRSWGTPTTHPDLLLVHGGAAHARWWDHIAPLLAADRRVVAVDLSGHGDSEYRAAYSLDGWADEVDAVLAAVGGSAPPVVAGHSMGGLVSSVLAARGSRRLEGLIVIDSPIEPSMPEPRAEASRPFGNARVYPSTVAPTERFRPIPAQTALPYIAEHVAETSVRQVEGGWSWKFDPAFANMIGQPPRTLDGLPCRAVFIAGERGILTEEGRAALDTSTEVPVVEIPDAGHAIMLDQPLALVGALRGILAGWATRR